MPCLNNNNSGGGDGVKSTSSLLPRLLLPLLLLLLLSCPGGGQYIAAAESPETTTPTEAAVEPLWTEPYQQSVLSGDGATVRCHLSAALHAAGYGPDDLAWRLPDGAPVSADWRAAADNSTKTPASFRATNGTLEAANLTVADSGSYVCSLAGHNASAELQVYQMPSYRRQLILVWAVNGCLGLVFVLLGVHSLLPLLRSGGVSGVLGGGGRLRHGWQAVRSESAASSPTAADADADTDAEAEEEEAEAETAVVKVPTVASWRRRVKSHRHHSSVAKPACED